MAVCLEFIDFIVPIPIIRQKYPGGWEACLEDHADAIGGRVWFDDWLFRDGAMSPHDIGFLVEEWTSLGFETTSGNGGAARWNDFCVVEAMMGGPTLTCDWIVVDRANRSAHYAGTDPGKLVGRD